MASRYKPISVQIDAAIKGTAAEIRANHIAIAKREHAKVMAAAPRPARFVREVDGVAGAKEEAVKEGGRIRYVYPRMDDVVTFAMDTLFDRSPVDSGEYRGSHTVFLNGTPVSNLKDWKSGDEVAISTIVPYARKIELGLMTMRLPGTDFVYMQAEQIVKRRYGNIANIRYTFRALFGGNTSLERWAGSTRFQTRFHKPSQPSYAEWTRRQPTLIFTER